MFNETKIREAARDVQQLIPDLNTWKLSVSTIKSEESQDFSWEIELSEHSYPIRYIRVTLKGIDEYQNISEVALDYGWMLQQSGYFSVEAVLDGRTFNNHAESAMRDVSFNFPPSYVEEQTNSLTSLAYKFISKLIKKLESLNDTGSSRLD